MGIPSNKLLMLFGLGATILPVLLSFPSTPLNLPQPQGASSSTEKENTAENFEAFVKRLEGKWEGTSKTWFRPGELADDSEVSGEFAPLLKGYVRHTYQGSMMGKKRTGEETLVFNPARERAQISWFDSFHMSQGILFSEGEATAKGCWVKGSYATGPGQPEWGWKTVYEIDDEGKLTITAFNILPSGEEAKAVETVYQRKNG